MKYLVKTRNILKKHLLSVLIMVAIWGSSMSFFYFSYFRLFFTDIFLILIPILLYIYKLKKNLKVCIGKIYEENIDLLTLFGAFIIDSFYYVLIFSLGCIMLILTVSFFRLEIFPKIIITIFFTLFVYKQYFIPSKGYKHFKICFNQFESIILINNYLYLLCLLLFVQPLLVFKIIGGLFMGVETIFILISKKSMLVYLFKIKRYEYCEVGNAKVKCQEKRKR